MSNMVKKLILGLFLFCTIVFGPCKINVSASQMQEKDVPLLYVTGYEVTNESITPGTEFILTISVKNFSSTEAAESVVVVVSNPEGIVPEYGTVSMSFVEKIAPGASENVEFAYTANSDIKGSSLNFNVSVENSINASGAQLRIPVGRLTDFSVEKYSVPEKIEVGKIGYASALIENISSGGVNDVIMIARSDGKDIALANVGTIAAGTTKSQYVELLFDKEGTYTVELLLSYTDSDGESKEFTISKTVVEIASSVEDTADLQENGNMQSENVSTDNSKIEARNIMVICISGVLLIVLCCVIFMLLYRRK